MLTNLTSVCKINLGICRNVASIQIRSDYWKPNKKKETLLFMLISCPEDSLLDHSILGDSRGVSSLVEYLIETPNVENLIDNNL